MGDVSQILGVSSKTVSDAPPPPSRAMKLKTGGKPIWEWMAEKEGTVNTADLPPAVPSTVKVGTRNIDPKKPARKWAWAPFTSSSRPDGLVLRHWVRAGVEYPDYPFARFDIHLDPVAYSTDEYKSYLKSESWTKGETDLLMELARCFELRWAVIHDRWIAAFEDEEQEAGDKGDKKAEDQPPKLRMRKVEELQHRYYSVAALLTQSRVSQEAAVEVKALEATTPSDSSKRAADQLLLETAAARSLAASDPKHQPLIHNVGSGTTNKVFDLNQEIERRAQIDALWDRPKEEEEEEAALRYELKQIEARLRKLKKGGAHLVNKKQTNASRPISPNTVVEKAFGSAPIPTAKYPFLQSGRLVAPTGVNKVLVNRLETVLKELKIPERPLPTRRVCDLYDSVRKDALMLTVLQKNTLQREGLVQARRLKLAKMGGNLRVVDEETLMGITQTPARKPTKSPQPIPKATAKPAVPRGTSTGISPPLDAEGEKKVKKAAPKRKRKPDSKSPVPTGSVTPTTAATLEDGKAAAAAAKKRARKT